MQELDRATGGSVEKMGKLLGSSMAARAGLALTGAGGKKFAETLELMNNKAGAAAEAYEKMASTTERAWARLKARFNELKLMVGEGLANAFGNASNSISDFFDMLSDSGQLQEFVDSITDGLKRAVVAVAAGVGGIVAGIRFLVSEYAKSGGSITKIWESIARAHIEAVGFIVRVFKTIQMIVGETAASSVWDAMARVIFELFRFLQMQALEAGIRMIEALGKPLVLIGALLTAFALLTGNVAAAKLGLKIGKMVVGLIVARVALEAAHEGIRTMPFGTAGAGIKAATDAASNAMKDLPDKWKNAWNDPETVKATDKMREAVADVFGVDIPNIAGDAGKSTGDSFMSGLGDAISKGSAEARKAAEKALGGDIAAPEAAAPDAPRGWGPVRSGIEPPTAAAMAAREVQEAAAARAAAMRAAAKRTTEDATVAPATPSPSAAGDMPQPVMPPPEPGAPTDERGAPPLMPMRPSGAEMGDGRDMPGADIGGARDTGGPIPQPDINININIDGDVSDPDKLARAVGVEFDKRMGKWRWAATV